MSEYTIADLHSVFLRLNAAKWPGILIGGQAVNLYASHYQKQMPGIELLRPLASRDLDFHGGPRDAKRAMEVLHATGKINDGSDPSPNAGVLQVSSSERLEMIAPPCCIGRAESWPQRFTVVDVSVTPVEITSSHGCLKIKWSIGLVSSQWNGNNR